jgi:hypothetical protein
MSSCHGAHMDAPSLHHSKRALDYFYRRIRTKLRAPKAITAAAHKLARIIFHLMTTRHEFNDSRLAVDQLCYQTPGGQAPCESQSSRIPGHSAGTGRVP